jgi:FMN phosphatase YigB (HAD superfamily)
MEKLIIDTGKLLKIKKKFFNILINYELIIFDLDDTIFPLYYYDKIIFDKIALKISKKFNINRLKLFKFLLLSKYFNKKEKKLFNIFLKKFNLSKFLSEKKLVQFYQNYPKIKNFKPPSIIDLIKKLKKRKKKLMLITEGNGIRQQNKINSLGVEKLFDYKIILDGKYNRKYKPSSNGVKNYLKIINMKKSVYLGDSDKDKKLSDTLNVKFYKFDISRLLKKSD